MTAPDDLDDAQFRGRVLAELKEIRDRVTQTNGRVLALERAQIEHEARADERRRLIAEHRVQARTDEEDREMLVQRTAEVIRHEIEVPWGKLLSATVPLMAAVCTGLVLILQALPK